MVALSRSGQQPRIHRVGTPPATILSAALLVTLLLGAGCGRTTTGAGTSGPHPTATTVATPTSAILPEAPLSWTVGHGLPSSPCAMNVSGQFDVGGINDPSDGSLRETDTSHSGAVVQVYHPVAETAFVHQLQAQANVLGQGRFAPS